MNVACTLAGCAVVETGRCALEKSLDACPNRIGSSARAGVADTSPATVNEASDAVGAPVLAPPAEAPRFPSSTTLGPEAIEALMASRYVTVVGILGDPDAGKTACLASLYLLVSNATLEGWSFADSRSLMAFEEIARGARRWNEGGPPQQMTSHTEMADERRPGFLHLRLLRTLDGRRFDLALPDLPGEWTKTLIRSGRTDRFDFMRSADVVWLVIDGRALADRERRQGAITRLGQLTGRLRAMTKDAVPRLILVITHQDVDETPPEVLARLTSEMAKHGGRAEIIPVAPFSNSASRKAGYGLAELVSATVGSDEAAYDPWPTTKPKSGVRSYVSHRRDR